jgi:hypothetical protein
LFDPDNLGLVAFPTFSKTLDTLLNVSNKAKENLFKKLDRLSIGMFAYSDFKKVINSDEVGLRLLDIQPKTEDSFEWEQNIIRRILDWILNNRLSLT